MADPITKTFNIDFDNGMQFRKIAHYPTGRPNPPDVVYKLEVSEKNNKPFKIAAIVMSKLSNNAKIKSMDELAQHPEYHQAMVKKRNEARTSNVHTFEITLRYPTDIVLACIEPPESFVKGTQSTYTIAVNRSKVVSGEAPPEVKPPSFFTKPFFSNKDKDEVGRNRAPRQANPQEDGAGNNGEIKINTNPPRTDLNDAEKKDVDEGLSMIPAYMVGGIALASFLIPAIVMFKPNSGA